MPWRTPPGSTSWGDSARLAGGTLGLLAGACAAVLAGAAVGDALLLVPLWVVGGCCNGGLNVLTNVMIAARVPTAARGRAYATMTSAVQGAGMIGFVAGGPLVDAFPPRPLVLAAGIAGLIAVLVCVPGVRPAMGSGPPGAAVTPGKTAAGDSVGE